MKMEIARLVLEYVKALACPLTVVALSLYFRSEIKRLLARLRKAVLPGGGRRSNHARSDAVSPKIFSVCNQAMHGRFVSREEAEGVISPGKERPIDTITDSFARRRFYHSHCACSFS
jgi:hypothetical protein